LVRRAAGTLAADGVQAPNGRVTPLPDRRVVRWYTTIGLVDRPLAFRGRTALYGARHLLQVVAVKRRQAAGRSLAEIQAELAGATDATLHRVAQVPGGLLAGGAGGGAAAGAAVSNVDNPMGTVSGAASGLTSGTALGAASDSADAVRRRFWAERPAQVLPPASVETPSASVAVPGAELPTDLATPLYAVPLHAGVTLLLRGQPDPDDIPAVYAAARPLLDLLAVRGLLGDPLGNRKRAPDASPDASPDVPPNLPPDLGTARDPDLASEGA
jgi:hypothetical protein